jgi:hypothetical protein
MEKYDGWKGRPILVLSYSVKRAQKQHHGSQVSMSMRLNDKKEYQASNVS